MRKDEAIYHLGGSIASAATALGCSYEAVSGWPSDLPKSIADRVNDALDFVGPRLVLLERDGAPAVVPSQLLETARTYREACRLCWTLRRVKGMRPVDLARDHGFTRQHVGDYLADDDLETRRCLPASRIHDFELACGNSAVSQWLAARARLTVLEQMQADEAARRALEVAA